MVMGVRSAELTKYAANAMLATRISFMNELANLAEAHRRRHRGSAPRHRLRSAHRLPVPLPGRRLRRLVLPEGREGAAAHRASTPARPLRVLDAVEEVNDAQKHVLGDEDRASASATTCTARRFALWGLAFKANTDDMREAREPHADRRPDRPPAPRCAPTIRPPGTRRRRSSRRQPDVHDRRLARSAALEGADALAIVTEWQEFRSPDFAAIKAEAQDAGDLRRPQPL